MTVTRCAWVPEGDAIYAAYHDEEWGVPERDSRALYEKLVLDGFQAGLSWRTILYKRDNFRAAFQGFEPEVVARFTEKDIARLLGDAGIIRHRGKIEGAVANARVWLDMREAGEDFAAYLWNWVDGTPLQNGPKTTKQVPAATPLSEAIAKDMKKRGFKFCGPVIVYAFMQATGMVNDHLVSCHAHTECRQLAQ